MHAIERWQESVTAYQEVVQMLGHAADEDYDSVHTSAEIVRLASEEIKQILDEHEREHACGPRS